MDVTQMSATDGTRTRRATAKWAGVTVSPKTIAAGVIVIAAVWFILINRSSVSIYLWVPKVTAPMWVILLITFAGGTLTGILVRRNRKQQ
jgi:uncharacterized integral membrane protein